MLWQLSSHIIIPTCRGGQIKVSSVTFILTFCSFEALGVHNFNTMLLDRFTVVINYRTVAWLPQTLYVSLGESRLKAYLGHSNSLRYVSRFVQTQDKQIKPLPQVMRYVKFKPADLLQGLSWSGNPPDTPASEAGEMQQLELQLLSAANPITLPTQSLCTLWEIPHFHSSFPH